jgi:CRISPR-associated protein Cas1
MMDEEAGSGEGGDMALPVAETGALAPLQPAPLAAQPDQPAIEVSVGVQPSAASAVEIADDTAPLRVMALHALLYCERLFYLEEVEEIRVADAAVYAGRTLHHEIEAPDETGTERRSVQVSSDRLGLTGRVDALRRREGDWVAYEHKRGRPRRGGNGAAEAWPSDAVQVSAYGMLLEEELGEPVAEGRIRYHAENVTVRVPLDEAARTAVQAAVARARELRASTERPPITEQAGLCTHCSLAPVCLPEEGRLVRDPDWQPLRLFPPELEGQIVHITSHRARVGRAGDGIVIEGIDDGPVRVPVHGLQAVVVHGNAQVSTQALHLCASNEVPVHWLTAGGRYIAGLVATPGAVQRRVRQYRALSEPGVCLRLARRLAVARVESQIRYLLRGTRGAARSDALAQGIIAMRDQLRAIPRAEGVDAVRGHEGAAGRVYFSLLPLLLGEDVPDLVRPHGRSRRPPPATASTRS